MRMPVAFVGHGSPMNVIENNEYTRGWQEMAARIPRPEAVLVISAHWFRQGNVLTAYEAPPLIYDFYGFPEELYQVQYPAPGAPRLAAQTGKLIGEAAADPKRGLDHGAWTVLKFMYPGADIPVAQLSVNRSLDTGAVFELGRRLRPLREQGVLILASGNVVHNLALVNFSMRGGYPWADEFDAYIRGHLEAKAFENVVDYRRAGESARKAFFTPDHFYPLLYAAGAARPEDPVWVTNDARVFGGLSMTSYLFG